MSFFFQKYSTVAAIEQATLSYIVTADQASRQLHTASGLEAYRKGSAVHLLIYLGCISGTSDHLKSINLSVHKVIMPVWM